MNRTRGRHDGFMLVEALAALTLGALILVGLLSLSGLLRRSADRAAAAVEVSEISTRTVETIARELRQIQRRRWAVPPTAPVSGARPTTRPTATGSQQNAQGNVSAAARAQQMNAAGQGEQQEGQPGEPDAQPRPFAFSGAPDRVAFALTPRQENGLRAPVFVAWQFDETGAVLRSEAPLRFDAMGPQALEFGPVARIDPGPQRLRFAYVERLPDGGETILDAWSDAMKMPAAIRIDRLGADGSPAASLRVPLVIDGEPGCAGQKGLCSRTDNGASAQQPDQPNAGNVQPGAQQ